MNEINKITLIELSKKIHDLKHFEFKCSIEEIHCDVMDKLDNAIKSLEKAEQILIEIYENEYEN